MISVGKYGFEFHQLFRTNITQVGFFSSEIGAGSGYKVRFFTGTIIRRPLKADELNRELHRIARRFGIEVTYENLKKAGVPVQSGLCKVSGKPRLIIDKHATIRMKNEILAGALNQLPLEEIFVAPLAREYLEKNR